MTTLVSLVTKDSAVLGCDSLATVVKPLVDPRQLFNIFRSKHIIELEDYTYEDLLGFDLGVTLGELDNLQINHPINHFSHVDKLYSLAPLKMGVMITGIAGLGNRTIKSLISEFIEENFNYSSIEEANKSSLKDIAINLRDFIRGPYDSVYPEELGYPPPSLEFILAGYSNNEMIPNTARITLPDGDPEFLNSEFGIMFGGQTKEIQRIINGIDDDTKDWIDKLFKAKLGDYHKKLTDSLTELNITAEFPDYCEYIDENGPFDHNWNIEQFNADWGNFSEQNAIECVHWLVEIMSKSQQFSSSLPSVGGDINLAIITKKDGFKFVSKREYQVGAHSVPREG